MSKQGPLQIQSCLNSWWIVFRSVSFLNQGNFTPLYPVLIQFNKWAGGGEEGGSTLSKDYQALRLGLSIEKKILNTHKVWKFIFWTESKTENFLSKFCKNFLKWQKVREKTCWLLRPIHANFTEETKDSCQKFKFYFPDIFLEIT